MGASFDCGAATTYIEKLICSDDTLNQADEEMAASYKSALVIDSATKDMQVKWLTEVRNKCRDANCLTDAYLDQLSMLERIVSSHKMIALKSLQQNGSDHKEVADQGSTTKSGRDPISDTVLYAFVAAASLLIIMVINGVRLGLTDKMIFYDTGWDLLGTLLIWILPVLLSFPVLLINVPPEGQGGAHVGEAHGWLFVIPFVIGLGMLVWTFIKSLRQNGLSFGSLCVATSKIALSWLVFFYWGQANSQKTTWRARANALIFLSLLAWLMSCLVNGARVRQERLDFQTVSA